MKAPDIQKSNVGGLSIPLKTEKNPTLIPNFLLFIPIFLQVESEEYNSIQCLGDNSNVIQLSISRQSIIKGTVKIEKENSLQKIYVDNLFVWFEEEKNRTMKEVIKNSPEDFELYGMLTYWFDQIKEKIIESLPERFVRRVVVFEDMKGSVTSVGYEYYPEEETDTEEIAFRIRTIKR